MKSEYRKSPVLRRFLAIGLAVPLFLGLLVFASPADALLQSLQFSGNDCPGTFGQPFGSCVAFGSPVIIKFDVDEGEIEINSGLFPTIDGSEFDFIPDLNNSLTFGSWTYTPGPGDPEIKYWAVKGGPNFNLMWDGDEDPNSATSQTANSWISPTGCGQGGLSPCGISHISFYNTGDEFLPVPAPSTLVLLGTALSLLAVARRRR
jgi:hypothetical protein